MAFAQSTPSSSITPPAGHPRLFVRPAGLAGLKARTRTPFFAKAWQQALKNSASVFDGTLPATAANYDQRIHDASEACALRYLVEGDESQGHKAIAILRNVLPAVTYPNQQDITRAKGATILSAAIVYDWCFPLLTSADRTLFITHMKRIAKLTEISYPPVKGSAITGHSGEAQLMRDQLSGGIAVYDEDPEMYQFAVRRFFAEFVPARDFWYQGHWHHQGSSYGPYRFQWEMMSSWIFRQMSGVDVFHSAQSQVPYAWVYAQRPDGILFSDGDCGSILKRTTEPPFPNFSMLLTAHYYRDEVLNGIVMHQNQRRERLSNSIWFFLFADPNLGTRPITSLPLSRYFPDPAGRMVARTSWEEGATAPVAMAEMKISPWMFNNHQHLDAGHFQVWYKGALACGSGLYKYGTNHDVNYYKRTIAHNTVTVFDPDEKFVWTRPMPMLNDGGQRWPANGAEPPLLATLKEKGHQVGRVLAHAMGPDPAKPLFSHLSGDLTGTYSSKVRRFVRSFVFLNLQDAAHPAALLVYDRLTSAKASSQKTWLLHCPDAPELSAAGFVVRGAWGGRMDAAVVLPAAGDVQLKSVGGEGNEFQVNGVNQPQEETKASGPNYENCGWRVELSPRTPHEETRFLVVMQMQDDGPSARPLPLTPMQGDGWTGVAIADRVVIFPAQDGGLRNVRFRLTRPAHCVITGAEPGVWNIRTGGPARTATVTDSGRVLEFRAAAGEIECAL